MIESPQNRTQGDILMVIIHNKFDKNPSITFRAILTLKVLNF